MAAADLMAHRLKESNSSFSSSLSSSCHTSDDRKECLTFDTTSLCVREREREREREEGGREGGGREGDRDR